MIPLIDEKIIQIQIDTKNRLYLLTSKGNVYYKPDNYDGFILLARSEIRKKNVTKPEFPKKKKIFNLFK